MGAPSVADGGPSSPELCPDGIYAEKAGEPIKIGASCCTVPSRRPRSKTRERSLYSADESASPEAESQIGQERQARG